MSNLPYLPLSARSDREAAEAYEALHEFVTEWMAKPIQNWVRDFLQHWSYNDLASLFQLLRLKMEGDYTAGYYVGVLAQRATAPDHTALDILDICVRFTGAVHDGEVHRDKLATILSLSRSKWKIAQTGPTAWELQDRVDPATSRRADEAMKPDDSASAHLRRSWSAVHGIDRDPNKGYDYAIKAVEAAARPVVSPRNLQATSTMMIKDLKAKPEKWRFILDQRGSGGIEPVIEMFKSLAKSQRDRHGTDLERPEEQDMTQQEAEAALHLASTLVPLFRDRAIHRVDL